MGESWSDQRIEAARSWLNGKCPECGHTPLIQLYDVTSLPGATGISEEDLEADLRRFECNVCGWAKTADVNAALQQVDDFGERKRAAEDEDLEDDYAEREAKQESEWQMWAACRSILRSDASTAFLPLCSLEGHLESEAAKRLGSDAPSVSDAFGSWHSFAEQVFEARVDYLRGLLRLTVWVTVTLLATPLVAWREASNLSGGGPLVAKALLLVWISLTSSAIYSAIALFVMGGLAWFVSSLLVAGGSRLNSARHHKAEAWDRLIVGQ